MGKKKGKKGKGKKKGNSGQEKKKGFKGTTKTCGGCFDDLEKKAYSNKQWSKKSMDCICKKCSDKKPANKSGSKDDKKSTGKETTQKKEATKFVLQPLPKQFQPVKKKSETKLSDAEKVVLKAREKQTEDPSIAIDVLFPNGIYPVCERVVYPINLDHGMKMSKDKSFVEELEKRENEDVQQDKLKKLRKCAEVHRHLRKWVQRVTVPGMDLRALCGGIEERLSRLLDVKKLKGGFAFPIGCSINSIAAHFTPNPLDEVIIQKDDVLKIDIGLHCEGLIIDSAFTLTWNEKYNNLLKAVREGTNKGVEMSGIDARLVEIGEGIQEVMESYEVEMDGKNYPVKTIENLNGHSLDDYIVHSGIQVPTVKAGPEQKDSGFLVGQKMKEGELYAIETFGSINGKGRVFDNGACSHFMRHKEIDDRVIKSLKLKKSKDLFLKLNQNYKTLCFCPRWLPNIWNEKNYMVYLRSLVKNNIVKEYPPLCDTKNSYVAQYEHTLYLLPTRKEILSKGDDY